ncbi:hypothetical protein [Streptomyces sp. C1-2]|uniref:DUF7302 family protein n=1 Tax=Streptomyces sp. C1-2 TaxID=2720022 RepID=UPI001432755C|nr:hypothetical protein [Streptomyces sp. C1-2]NJP75231.1 hypothetical protein [Streptomyces sp. C1-2]
MLIRITQPQPEGAVLNGRPWPKEGETADVPTAQGAHLVASGVAEPADRPAPRGKRRPAKEEGSDA